MSVHSMHLPRIKRRQTVLRPSTLFKPLDNHPTNVEDDLDSTHRMYVLKTKDFLSAGNILKRYGAKHKVKLIYFLKIKFCYESLAQPFRH